MILLDGNLNLDGIFYLIIAIMFAPAILLTIIGLLLRKNNKKAAKIFFMLAVIYVIVSMGVCGSMIM